MSNGFCVLRATTTWSVYRQTAGRCKCFFKYIEVGGSHKAVCFYKRGLYNGANPLLRQHA